MENGKLLTEYWNEVLTNERDMETVPWLKRKWELHRDRGYRIVRVTGEVTPYQKMEDSDRNTDVRYLLKTNFVLKKKEDFYVEESEIDCRAQLKNGVIDRHEFEEELSAPVERDKKYEPIPMDQVTDLRFTYDRRSAVRYAERWWNSYNPEYRKFTDDCTNFISQCMRAGGAPMWGSPNRGKGWWYSGKSWSYSWAVAHSFRWYLSGSRQGLTGKEVDSPKDLIPGDVICYDFEGDGRWNHNTIVVMKDSDGMPLVNAHTYNSRHRYWSYEDSTAYTPNIEYKFFRIGD